MSYSFEKSACVFMSICLVQKLSALNTFDQTRLDSPATKLVYVAFLLYVNDIHKCSNKLRFYLFADDTNILYADKNVKALETTITFELGKFYVWLIANKLTLNIKVVL